MATATSARRVSIGHYAGPDPLVLAAKELGMGRNSIEQLCYGRDNVFRRCAVIVSAMVRSGQSNRADGLLARVFAARQGVTSLPLSPSVILQAQDADLNEDIAEAYYNSTHTRESLIEWRRRLKLQIAESLRLLTAIETELEA